MKAIVIENHPADSRVKIKEDGICQSLTSRMGTGGGQRTIGALLHQIKKGAKRGTRYLLYQDKVGALCATDYKWVQQEQVMQGKLIVYETDRGSEE